MVPVHSERTGPKIRDMRSFSIEVMSERTFICVISLNQNTAS